ncbi:MAG: ISL3 family transposase, partial [Candidatus Delongbacteria bacterium]
ELTKINENINKAMILKEEFRMFYEAKNQEEANKILSNWIEECNESKLKPFIKLARRLNRWKDGLLEYFKNKISNGISEGINNKIKVIKRRSYGFYDMNYFFLKILMATGFLPHIRKIKMQP